jgi:hypothetical protein
MYPNDGYSVPAWEVYPSNVSIEVSQQTMSRGHFSSPFDAEPSQEAFQKAVYSGRLKTIVTPGTFVLCGGLEETTAVASRKYAVYRIVDIRNDDNHIKLNVFMKFDDSLCRELSVTNAQLAAEELMISVQEICQTDRFVWVPVDSISGIAIVLKRESFDESVDGQKLVYLLRYSIWPETTNSSNTIINRIEQELCQPFPCSYCFYWESWSSSSFVATIWSDILAISSEMVSMLHSTALCQGLWSRRNRRIRISKGTFNFLMRNTRHTLVESAKQRMKKVVITKPGLETTAVALPVQKKIVRYESEDELFSLSCIFGSSVGMAPRKRLPKLGEFTKIRRNDTINVVLPFQDQVSHSVSTTSHNDGVDFIYEDDGWLRIQVRYSAFFVNRPYSELLFPCRQLEMVLLRHGTGDESINSSDDITDFLRAGAEFDDNNSTFEIIRTTDNLKKVEARCISKSSTCHYFNRIVVFTDSKYVVRQIKEKLGM